MLVKTVLDAMTAPLFGMAVIASPDDGKGLWTELGVIGILAMLLWQVTQYMLTSKKEATASALFVDDHVLHDKLCEDMASDVEQLLKMHHDPNSGFSTLFMGEQMRQLVDLQKEILTEMRKHTP